MISRKGQVSSGITWFVAIIAVFFIMLLFTGSMLTLAGRKKVSEFFGEERIEMEEGEFMSIVLTKNIISFLNTDVAFKGGIIGMDKLIESAPIRKARKEKLNEQESKSIKIKSKVFQQKAKDIFDIIYPIDRFGLRNWQSVVHLPNDKRFWTKAGVGGMGAYEFKGENLFYFGNGQVCNVDEEFAYSEIMIDNKKSLFICVKK